VLIALLVVGGLGLLGAWQVTFFGLNLGAPLNACLAAAFGPEGVGPGQDFAAGLFLMMALVGAVLLLGLLGPLGPKANRRVVAPETRLLLSYWKQVPSTWMVFMIFLGFTIFALAGLAFDTPGSWFDENLGPPAFSPVEMVISGAITLLLGLYLIYLNRKVRELSAIKPE